MNLKRHGEEELSEKKTKRNNEKSIEVDAQWYGTGKMRSVYR